MQDHAIYVQDKAWLSITARGTAMTTNISFQCTADEAQLDELLFSNGRTLQGARDIEIYDELSLRHHPLDCKPADAQRALSLAKWRVISVFRDSVGVRRAQAGELIGFLTEAMFRLNALTDETDALGITPI
jgi:hypothetical protein